jgi:uncharacterized protein (DUF3820 family)
MNPEDLEKLVTREMPFGKYKGRLIADLPGSYLHWFAREGDVPRFLGPVVSGKMALNPKGRADEEEPIH